MLVGDNLWDRGVCWKKLGTVSASGEQGVLNLTEIGEASTTVGDICPRLRSGGTDHGTGAGAAAVGRKY